MNRFRHPYVETMVHNIPQVTIIWQGITLWQLDRTLVSTPWRLRAIVRYSHTATNITAIDEMLLSMIRVGGLCVIDTTNPIDTRCATIPNLKAVRECMNEF